MADLSNRYLFCFGLGYCAAEVVRQAQALGMRVGGTVRDSARVDGLRRAGIEAISLTENSLASNALSDVTDLLVSTPPDEDGCPAWRLVSPHLLRGLMPNLRWVGYLSSTAVYGDCNGAWIDEGQAPNPRGRDAKGRLVAEAQWRSLTHDQEINLDVLRIAGIYGPDGRNSIGRLRSGSAKAIIKPGQVFNRIHRDDIARAVLAAFQAPMPDRLLNLADGHPCSSAEILIDLAKMLDLPEPQTVPLEKAGLPPGAAGFYAENRRLKNERLLELPGFLMRHPDWRSGYAAILQEEG